MLFSLAAGYFGGNWKRAGNRCHLVQSAKTFLDGIDHWVNHLDNPDERVSEIMERMPIHSLCDQDPCRHLTTAESNGRLHGCCWQCQHLALARIPYGNTAVAQTQANAEQRNHTHRANSSSVFAEDRKPHYNPGARTSSTHPDALKGVRKTSAVTNRSGAPISTSATH